MPLQIERMSLDEIKTYPNNAKIHTAEQIEQIKESIRSFGFNDPIAIWHNEIVEGHGRFIAAQELGFKEIDVIRLDELSDEQRRAYMLVHNKLTMNTGFDMELLEFELENIDMDMEQFGFDDELSVYDDDDTEIIEDEIPENVETRCKTGDIWKLGEHRLICGDSTKEETFAKLMNGEKAKMLFTSPPYSDMREYNGGKDLSVTNLVSFIEACREYTDYQCINLGIQRKNNEIVQYWDEYIKKAKDVGYKFLAWNVWDKTMAGSIGQQSAFFPIRHEWVFVFGTEFYEINETWEKKESSIHEGRIRKVRQADGSMKSSTTGDTTNRLKQMESVVTVCSETGSIRSEHPAVFPVQLPFEYIKAMSDEGDIVIEPFGGSGSTIIACEQANRKCYASEIDPHYCDVIIQRWEAFTGEEAERV